ncbi:MAG: CopG family transcriptional regulator [Verrucomicrobiota bacterium]
MKTVSVKLPETLDGWLTQRARQLGRSRSAIVREALERQRSKLGQATCLDLMQDVCGSVRGPSDLSFNPRHLEGLGR